MHSFHQSQQTYVMGQHSSTITGAVSDVVDGLSSTSSLSMAHLSFVVSPLAISAAKERPPLYSYTFGGVSAVGAVFFTHPFDLLKVHLQTSKKENLGLIHAVRRILKQQGFAGLYQGISGGAMREGTYSTMRFAVYHFLKDDAIRKNDGEPISTAHNVLLGMIGGALGGAFGNPADIVNIRMQADSRMPADQRRNYKHAVDGLLRVRREEGAEALMRGVRPNIIRAMLLTTGQIAAYDLAKAHLLHNPVHDFEDNVQTHILSSMVAGLVATTACAPADVVKTRLMNMKHGEYKSATDCFLKVIEHEGLRGLYKGWLPAYMRLGPQTLLTFVFLEQLRKRLL